MLIVRFVNLKELWQLKKETGGTEEAYFLKKLNQLAGCNKSYLAMTPY